MLKKETAGPCECPICATGRMVPVDRSVTVEAGGEPITQADFEYVCDTCGVSLEQAAEVSMFQVRAASRQLSHRHRKVYTYDELGDKIIEQFGAEGAIPFMMALADQHTPLQMAGVVDLVPHDSPAGVALAVNVPWDLLVDLVRRGQRATRQVDADKRAYHDRRAVQLGGL